MKKVQLKIWTVAFLILTTTSVFAQDNNSQDHASDLSDTPKPKRFLSAIELFAGPTLYFPNDHGWAEYVFKGSDGRTIYKANQEMGYSIGISLVHSINSRFELLGKFSMEKKRYSSSEDNLDLNGNITSESETDQKNDYLVISLVPVYFTSELNRLQFFAGISCAFLTHSIASANYFSAGQPAGGATVNTIDGFEKYVIDALAGVGYSFTLSKKIEASSRIQGNYGLSYTSSENKQHISINSISLSFVIRYNR